MPRSIRWRALAEPLDEADSPRLATAAMTELVKAWRHEAGDFAFDPRGLVAAQVAVSAIAEPAISEAAALVGAGRLEWSERRTPDAFGIIASARALIPADYALRPDFARLGVECAGMVGETALCDRLLESPLHPSASEDEKARLAHAALDLRRAEHLIRKSDIEEAETLTRGAQQRFSAGGDERMRAMASGQIADILYARGELDEALRIRREEQLPVYERLGDVRSRAVTLQKIAIGLLSAGALEQGRIPEVHDALAESFGIFTRLKPSFEVADVGAQLAQVVAMGGLADEALGVLDVAEAAFQKLGQADGGAHV